MEQSNEIAIAKNVLKIEAHAIIQQSERLDRSFLQVIETIAALKGKVVITGVGKSGIIGMKMAATLASMGTPAFFMHPVEGMHGDLGVLSSDDLLVAISNSGETEEVLNVVSAARRLNIRTLGIGGARDSTLASLCDHFLDVTVDQEACPLGLAPTASTTAMLAIGDALAITLSTRKNFSTKKFAAFHPGGTLRRRLKLRVKDLMRTGDRIPIVKEKQSFLEAVHEMTRRENLGVTLVCNDDGQLTGILTDGDLRRAILRAENERHLDYSRPVAWVMTLNPKTVEADANASEALQIMEKCAITSLAIVDAHSRPVGIIHLHDLLGRGKVLI